MPDGVGGVVRPVRASRRGVGGGPNTRLTDSPGCVDVDCGVRTHGAGRPVPALQTLTGARPPVDAIVTTLVGAAPQLGVAGILLTLLGLVIRREGQDRSDYRAQLTDTATRHDAELTRITTAHDSELAELRAEIGGLRAQLVEVNNKLDAERDRRRVAEDSALARLDKGRHRSDGGDSWPAA